MSTSVYWSTFLGADCDSFKLYRAITGLAVEFPNSLQVGDKLVFAATTQVVQTVTLTGTTATTVASNIKAVAVGVKETVSQSGRVVFIRATASGPDAKFKLLACTFATNTGETPRLITPRTEFELLTTQPRITDTFDYTYIDDDGDASDWYHITSVSGSTESIPSLDMQALPTPDPFCVVEGRVTDLQNRPVVGAEIRVQSLPPPHISSNAGLVTTELVTLTDSYGRWSIPLLQGQSVLFRIPAVSYNNTVTIPAQRYVLFKDLLLHEQRLLRRSL